MKTLKYQLLAASMFACATAFGQANMAPVITPNGPNATALTNAKGGANSGSSDTRYNTSRQGYINDSYVLQQGNDQYARVNQTGGAGARFVSGNGGGANQGDILQGPNGNGNNASQTQNFTGTNGANKNIGYIYQNGTNGSATQEQTGDGNTASIRQNGATSAGGAIPDGNTAYQRQTSNQNSAEIVQQGGSFDQAIQFQSVGVDNTSTIMQTNGSYNRAQTDQQGARNTAVVTQQ